MEQNLNMFERLGKGIGKSLLIEWNVGGFQHKMESSIDILISKNHGQSNDN